MKTVDRKASIEEFDNLNAQARELEARIVRNVTEVLEA